MTARVDFYVLESDVPDGRLRLACRVTEKAYRAGHRVYLRAGSKGEISVLDALLWTFSQSSFVPHALAGTNTVTTPVLIGHGAPDPAAAEVVVSVANEPVVGFSYFARIAEVVGGKASEKASGRQRFRFYREQGIEPATHPVRL
ncbi:MAG TPA: DNA polymerase III subunit chi [Gammaproteobacteria bacterium]|jgi:DNA polymerase-3 subunit chi|nr:DNA polymerase III subunit chi [Gammaproteobacteria bacterium]|tara:strand:- start:1659 stop:2090 length:432 start_codon:yes stop_codon:yes gene_type:complete